MSWFVKSSKRFRIYPISFFIFHFSHPQFPISYSTGVRVRPGAAMGCGNKSPSKGAVWVAARWEPPASAGGAGLEVQRNNLRHRMASALALYLRSRNSWARAAGTCSAVASARRPFSRGAGIFPAIAWRLFVGARLFTLSLERLRPPAFSSPRSNYLPHEFVQSQC